jgi:hypothetical protein
MTAKQKEDLRRAAEDTVKAGYHATTRAMAEAGEAVGDFGQKMGEAIDRFKTGVQFEIDQALGRLPQPSPRTAPHPLPVPPPPAPTKRDAARAYGGVVLMDRLAEGEGTGGLKGYETTFGYGRYDPPGRDKPMTLDELAEFQRGLRDRTRRETRYPTSAVGRYQTTKDTMHTLRRNMGLTGSEVYSPELQDRLAREHLRIVGWDDYVAGKITRDQPQKKFAQTWASVAEPSGRPRSNQPVGTTSEQFQAAIAQAETEARLRGVGADPSANLGGNVSGQILRVGFISPTAADEGSSGLAPGDDRRKRAVRRASIKIQTNAFESALEDLRGPSTRVFLRVAVDERPLGPF